MGKPEIIGNATLYLGDCRDILPILPKVDAVITDPPYGIWINKSNRLSISRGFGADTWDNEPADKESIYLIREMASKQIIWGGNYFELPPTRCYLIWDKDNDGRDFADCEQAWTNLDAVARIFRMRPMNMDGGKEHPTQKPTRLMEWCIKQCGSSADIDEIIDPYMGSGSTGIACMYQGRRFIGIEREQKYFDIACRRIEDAQRQQRLLP
jgi:site-specific DNA-methyltransferase (adenine-specific)